jgi:predicted component of type VI protein secretion system
MTPLVIKVTDTETDVTTQFAFIKSPVRLGRSELNDLPLPQRFVSACHAVVHFDDNETRFVDLGSTNGSSVNGTELAKNVAALIEPDTKVEIGTLSLQFVRTASKPSVAAPRHQTQFGMRVSQLMPSAVVIPQAPPEKRAPTPLPPSPEQLQAVEGALGQVSLDLDLLYASYRATWEQVRGLIDQTVAGVDEAARPLMVQTLAEKYEGLRHEPQFKALSPTAVEPARLAAPLTRSQPAPPPQAPLSDRGAHLLATFAKAYVPNPDAISSEKDMRRLLDRTAEVLEAFGKSYVELHKGYEEFGKEMGLRTARRGPVERARDAGQLLAYLLDTRAEGRTADLLAAFGDLMVHQVALLNGVAEGARAILNGIAPDSITDSSFQSVWPLKAASYWKTYEERWHNLADEAESLSDVLFGPEFARAYTTVMGKRGDDDKPELSERSDPRGPRPRPSAREEEDEDEPSAPVRRPPPPRKPPPSR